MKTLTVKEYRKLLAGKFEAEAQRDEYVKVLKLVLKVLLKDIEHHENSPAKKYIEQHLLNNKLK